jgi:hypothetical protein
MTTIALEFQKKWETTKIKLVVAFKEKGQLEGELKS